MIAKVKGEFVATCDECEETQLFGGVEDYFMNFLAAMKAAGWKVRKDGED